MKSPGIYIHIPYCKSKCGYCAFVSTPDLSGAGLYIDSLIEEMRGRRSLCVDGAETKAQYAHLRLQNGM
jgi:oxygen-independent coproporphyrinogen-3 oxidase